MQQFLPAAITISPSVLPDLVLSVIDRWTTYFTFRWVNFVAGTAVTFVILCVLCFLFKGIDRAVIYKWQQRHKMWP
ncbi:MAG: hypothetical protein KME35_18980 [Aphanocapsa sp. GSE-SYN-MK-11-07L]|jgi:uncharacterized membrane protein|nr:hypothetical protein [Aphanocapsa sp. GSE-SYN-MK-11-07L]